MAPYKLNIHAISVANRPTPKVSIPQNTQITLLSVYFAPNFDPLKFRPQNFPSLHTPNFCLSSTSRHFLSRIHPRRLPLSLLPPATINTGVQ
ncbi:hypothetical protein Ancab_016589 [Ancistrocladus abbreviatus]